jgi:streptomycin 6-kinase
MKYLWKPAPEEDLFPSMEMWCQGFQRYQKQYPGSNGPLPEEHVQRAGLRAEQLLKDNQEQFLLHGDLHHMNILQGESGSWLAIDPKGVIGEGAFEVGPLLYNPVPALLGIPGVDNIIQKRLDIVSENTGLNRTRIKDWCYVRAILSAIWDIEDGGNNWDFWIKIADLIAKIR